MKRKFAQLNVKNFGNRFSKMRVTPGRNKQCRFVKVWALASEIFVKIETKDAVSSSFE